MSQIVDTESAREFMSEVMLQVTPSELEDISRMLEAKSRFFQQKLARETLAELSEADLFTLLRSIFATRRQAGKILEHNPAEQLRVAIDQLLYETAEPAERFRTFCQALENVEDNLRYDLAGELLHYRYPDQFWLWSRWIWDPKTQTGALPLVIENFDLNAPDLGSGYLRVGQATAFVHEVGEAAGFQTISRTLFGTDVFLASVYAVYSYTVLRMRMTQEFNKVVPQLPEFTRRLLGVNHPEAMGLESPVAGKQGE